MGFCWGYIAGMLSNSGSPMIWIAAILLVVSGCSNGPDTGEIELVGDWIFQDSAGVWRTAEVPGCVHTDLLGHGLIPDPFHGVNEGQVEWIEDRDWRYRRPLPLPPAEGEWALEFSGLDTHAELQVNGRTVLNTNNMHRAWRLPAAELGLTGQDTLEVVFRSPVGVGQSLLEASPLSIPVSNEARPVGEQNSVFSRKAQYHFGWDWGPRLVTSGIWKPVRWVRIDQELPPFRLIPVSIAPEQAEYEVFFKEAMEGVAPTLERDGVNVPCGWNRIDGRRYRLTVPEPALWWPNGMGEQPLYDLALEDGEGRFDSVRFGIRTVEWNRGLDGFGQAMQCVVNGVPVQVRGANVIPPDFFPVRAEGRWSRVIDDAVAAHMNMIRIWGGAHYGEEMLYDLCDQHGILVWQDFMNACAMVPADAAWRTNFLAEAREQVLRLRNRTSLAIWAGNNETEKAWREWGWQDLYDLHGADSIAVEEAYRQLFERELPELVAELGGGEYQPSSPHNQEADRPRESGDQHDWGVWFGKAGFEFYTEEAGRFASEFGLQSLPDRRTLEAVGVQSYEDTVLQFRQRSRMEWLEPGFDGWDMMQFYAGDYFADPSTAELEAMDRLDTWIYLTQLTQAEGLRQAVERHRCSQGRTSGSLYWQLDDVWPTVSWSTVDHAGRWKLAHHAVRHANQPVRVLPDRTQGDRIVFVIANDSPLTTEGVVEWSLIDLAGDTATAGRFGVTVEAHTTASWSATDAEVVSDRHILSWQWIGRDRAATVHDAGHHTFRPVGDLKWEAVTLQVETMEHGVRLSTDVPAAGVWLCSASEGRFEDNGFFLVPGRPRTVGFLDPSGQLADPGDLRVVHFGQGQTSAP